MEPQLVLASASPRRAQILRSLGLRFRVHVANVDESLEPGERARAAAERLARKKALAVAAFEATLPVLAADTLVVCDDEALGKPASEDDAAFMLRRLAGRDHEVVTGVCLAHAGRVLAGIERSLVRFAPLADGEIAAYVATGEPLDKAGGYHIDGRGALLVESVTGSPSNVAGLPVRLVARLFAEAGVRLFP
ncbi:MAG TPA: Maf family protein [Vicinamibacteria bacterium]|nr:Maf family protein [Vicinamibacteria bacterium]